MSYTLGQAAQAVGKSKPTLSRAIKRGHLSAIKAEDGSYSIDPSELARVFRLAGDASQHMKHSEPPDTPAVLLDHLRQLLVEREETIRDLRTRLDASEGERRQLFEDHRRLTLALTTTPSERPTALPWPPTRANRSPSAIAWNSECFRPIRCRL